MIRRLTPRMVTALALGIAGVLVAVLAGLPEGALLVLPWLVLATLGMGHGAVPALDLRVAAGHERVLVDDPLELVTTATSTGAGLLKTTCEPSSAFWSPSLPPEQRRGQPQLAPVQPGKPVELVTEFDVSEWGTHDLGRIAVVFTHRYGLFESAGVFGNRTIVRVHPTPMQLRNLLAPWMVRRVSGTHASRASERGVEYADIRRFGPGDSPRDINWRASARSTDLWVSQRHPDRATDVLLFVDSFIESGHDVRTVFGLAVEAAVALAEGHLGATDRVGLIEFGGLVRWVTPGTGRVQLQRLTDALLSTGLYANAADRELPVFSRQALPPRSFVVALTPLHDERFIDALYAMRARGHDVAVVECGVFDGSAEGDRNSSGNDGAAADQRSVARVAQALWRAERAMLRDRLSDHGISVAQWLPGDHLAVALDELRRRRRQGVRVGGR